MINTTNTYKSALLDFIKSKYQQEVPEAHITFQETRKEFEGDLTLVVFPLAKYLGEKPDVAAQILGEFLQSSQTEIVSFNIIKGFLNLVLSDEFWMEKFANQEFEVSNPSPKKMVIEYSSPNTNKPLHLGHIRNNLLGYAVASIQKAAGNEVFKVQVVNDRGIHICKSMVAWQQFGNGETPESAGIKGDHLVGKYYVIFDKQYKQEIETLISSGVDEEKAKQEAPIMQAARTMLLAWEQNDPEVMNLWKTMNTWVYAGFEATYKQLGVDFDKYYYESETYLLGKEMVEKGLKDGIFYQKPDSSIWIDLSEEGLDHKLLLRSDGTSVYMTQDIGTAIERYKDFQMDGMVYTVGNEQDYHFKVLFEILKKMNFPWAQNCFHLSYGMVDLPSGRMKSREGTVVDADDLMQEVISAAEASTREKGKIDEMDAEDAESLFRMLGLGALKYYLLKVDPKKRMVFNPEESIDLQGNTGPFIQYTHARIKSILRKASEVHGDWKKEINQEKIEKATFYKSETALPLLSQERVLIQQLNQYPEMVKAASDGLNPAMVCAFAYDLATNYNRFYHDLSVLNEPNLGKLYFRLYLSEQVSICIKKSFELLGIEVPERM